MAAIHLGTFRSRINISNRIHSVRMIIPKPVSLLIGGQFGWCIALVPCTCTVIVVVFYVIVPLVVFLVILCTPALKKKLYTNYCRPGFQWLASVTGRRWHAFFFLYRTTNVSPNLPTPQCPLSYVSCCLFLSPRTTQYAIFLHNNMPSQTRLIQLEKTDAVLKPTICLAVNIYVLLWCHLRFGTPCLENGHLSRHTSLTKQNVR